MRLGLIKEKYMLRFWQFCVFTFAYTFICLFPSAAVSGSDLSKNTIPACEPDGALALYKKIYHKPNLPLEMELPGGESQGRSKYHAQRILGYPFDSPGLCAK
jgi:hypothetical protein